MRRFGYLQQATTAALLLALSASGAVAQSTGKQGAAAGKDAEIRALENRVQTLEKKLDTQQVTTTTEQKSVGERVSAIETQVRDQEKSIGKWLGIDLHAFIDGAYIYNFNNPQDRTNQLRVFDVDSNAFELQQANINLSRMKEDENLGFRINMDFGKVAEQVGRATFWSNNTDSTESKNSFELREAYLTYRLPFVEGLDLKAGKFVTLLGAEVINNYDNFNYNISRSFSFGYGIPFTHTGVLTHYKVNDVLALDAGLVNGWDNVDDNNSGKTFTGGIGITPADIVSMYFSGTYGPEQTDNGHSKRGAVTGVFTVKPADLVTLVLEGTYGNETDLVGANQNKSALWYGTAGYVIVKPADAWTLALRGEVFVDSDGVRFASAQAPNGSTAWAITPTVAFQVTEGLMWRNEYRHDENNHKVFENNHAAYWRGQDTIESELIYSF
jgi:hypothetical protein